MGFARLNRPWLHFLVLGLVFYAVQALLLPASKTIVGPLNSVQVSGLRAQWQARTGQQPTPQQLQRLMNTQLDQAMLFQHALALNLHLQDSMVYQRLIRNMDFLERSQGQSETDRFDEAIALRLHLDDAVVKRRLIQLVEQQLLLDDPPPAPTSKAVSAMFKARKAALVQAPMYSFEHVFFGQGQGGNATAAAARIRREGLQIERVRSLGAPFMQGYQFLNQTPEQLRRHFGQQFVTALVQAALDPDVLESSAAGQWVGPVMSIYGEHLVWLTTYVPARVPSLVEVEAALRRDLVYKAQKRQLACLITALRAGYDVQGWVSDSAAANDEVSCL